MTDTVNVDTLVETVREGIPDDYLGPDPNDPMAGEKWGPNPAVLAALSDLARRVAELEERLERERHARKAAEELNADEVLVKRTNLEAVIESERARVAELEADLRSIRLWWERKPWEGSPDPGSFGGHPYSPNERALGYGTISDPRFLPPALAGDGGGAPADSVEARVILSERDETFDVKNIPAGDGGGA